MDEQLAAAVRERAGHACEYCRVPGAYHPGPFEIEHVIPQQHGGPTSLGNLAYACLRWK
jgi:5-methylcytosine-specific restriction endonuclease McrA